MSWYERLRAAVSRRLSMSALDAVLMVQPHNTFDRARLAILRFLTFHNRLEGIMALTGVWWGVWTLAFPGFWDYWPALVSITTRFHGHPEILSWVLLVTGAVGYLGKMERWLAVRSVCTLAAFVCWSILTYSFLILAPIFALGVATYSLFAFQTLLTYIYLQTGVEQAVAEADARQADKRAGTQGGS